MDKVLSQFTELSRPTVSKLPWMKEVEMVLGTAAMLDQIADECIASGRYGLDLETTGRDQRAFPQDSGQLVTKDKIVGICIAPTKNKGYYIPVRHQDYGKNVPPRLIIQMIERIQAGGAVAVFHYAKFDIKFLRHDPAGAIGSWDSPKQWDCTLTMTYLRNPRQKQQGLKFLSKEELGREMIELVDLFPSEEANARQLNFSKLDPDWEPVVWYGCSDALNTLALWDILAPSIMQPDEFNNHQQVIYAIEKICMLATQWMEQCRIHIDRDQLVELIQLGQKEWWDCLQSVYEEISGVLQRDIRPPWVKSMSPYDHMVLEPDYMTVREMAKRSSMADERPSVKKSVPSLTDRKVRETVDFPASYDITIPSELGLLLREMGVEGLEVTPTSGQIKTAKDVLDRIITQAGEKHAWMKNVKRFREIMKSLGNVLFNVYRDLSPDRSPDGCVWANFNGTKVDTGRFSTPTPRDGDFFGQVNWNVQSTKAYYYDPKDPPPACVYRQREIISARPGYLLFACDYSGVELRIVTNISGEPKWLAEFFHCSGCDHQFPKGELPPPFCPKCGSDKIGDLHTLTAMGIFSDADPNDGKAFKIKRQIGKIVNFLLCYGGSGYAVMNATKVDKEEGFRIKNQFDKTYTGLLRWWRDQEKVASKQKYVTTAFGRKYPVPDIDHADNYFRGKAKRNAVNGPVQGSSADIMKYAMGLLYREFRARGWICVPGQEDRVLMVITIHDELVFEIKKDLVREAVPVIEDIMCNKTVERLNWTVPLKVDIEFGENWTVPHNLVEMTWNKGGGEWTPELVQYFPDRYQQYLANGGKPINGEAPAPLPPEVKAAPASPTVSPPSQSAAAPAQSPPQSAEPPPVREEGGVYVYKIPHSRMTADNAKKLAHVICKCRGRGVDTLRVRDELGNDLLGTVVKVAYEEFRLIARYEGL